jgi:hypothetical protein
MIMLIQSAQTQEEVATNDTNEVLFSTNVGRFYFKLFINKLHIFTYNVFLQKTI